MKTISNSQNEKFELLSGTSLEECLMQINSESYDSSTCYDHDPDACGNCGGSTPIR